MAGNKTINRKNPTGALPSKGGPKQLPQFINMHFLDKPIVQSGPRLGSNKHNKVAKVSK